MMLDDFHAFRRAVSGKVMVIVLLRRSQGQYSALVGYRIEMRSRARNGGLVREWYG